MKDPATMTDAELGASVLPQFRDTVIATARRLAAGVGTLSELQTAIQALEMAERLSRSS